LAIDHKVLSVDEYENASFAAGKYNSYPKQLTGRESSGQVYSVPPGELYEGDRYIYNIQVTNTSIVDAYNVTVSDQMPP